MKRTKLIAGVLAIAMAVTSITVSSTDADAAAKPKLTAKKTVKVGQKFKLKVKKITKKTKVTWKTSKKSVAKITKKSGATATIAAVKAGKATITASCKTGKKKPVKVTCKVTVKAKKKVVEPTVTPTDSPTSVPATSTPVAPTAEPTATPVPTDIPYYNTAGYYAGYDGNKSYNGKDNLYINYVMADSKEVNKLASACNKLTFKIDSIASYEMGIYVAACDKETWGCRASSLGESAKVGSFTTDGTVGQQVSVDLAGAALDAITNEKVSFGFYTTAVDKSKQVYCLYDMYVGYNNSDELYPVSLTYNTVGCTSSSKGIYSTRQKDSSAIISDSYESLASLTEAKGYKFGTCVTYDQIVGDKEFCNLVKKHCDSITATNEFKAYSLLNQGACKESADGMPTGMNYERADAICKWAEENGLKIRGHALVWDQSMCQWFFNEGYEENQLDEEGNVTNRASKEVVQQRLESYIEQVMTHFEKEYPGVIYCWDVVNEGLTDEQNGNGGDAEHYYIRTEREGVKNPFYEVLGYEYVKIAFEAARATADKLGLKDVDLVYNDYNVFQTYNDKRGRVTRLVQYLNKDNKLVDAVGMQGYLGYGQQSNCLGDSLVTEVEKTIQALSDVGVKVQLTEMAMRNFTNTEQYMKAHAEFSEKMFKMLADINEKTDGAFTSMSLWAFIDDPTLNYTDDEYEYDIYTPYSGLFDEVFTAKESFNSIYTAFGGTLPE